MTQVSKNYINALLADATYINLNPSMNATQMADALSERMTPTLAKFIADNFEVASAIDTPDIPLLGSGFDATVWKGRAGTEFEGQVFVSTRGTEPPGVDIWGADVDLAINVAARIQLIDMVNWWLRETTPEGRPAKQIKWLEPGVVLGDVATGTGNLFGVTSVQVNGHSLGGHLASSFARIFGGANLAETGSVRVESIQTFNSAGFNGDNAEFFFAQIEELLGTGMSSFAGVHDKQTNFFADNGIEITTNTWWFTQMGERTGLNQEESTGAANHSMYRITDLLALGAALDKLDSNSSIGLLNQFSALGSNLPAGSLEGVLDGLRRTLLGTSTPKLTIGDAKDSDPARMGYHVALSELQASPAFLALVGKATVTLTASYADLEAYAKQDFGLFLALQTLSPVAISTTDAGALATLKGAHSDLHMAWQADMNARLYGDTSYAYSYSDHWYQDRIAMLGKLTERNSSDIASGADSLQGHGFADHRYGGAGDAMKLASIHAISIRAKGRSSSEPAANSTRWACAA